MTPRPLLALLLLAALACGDDDPGQVACTEEFRVATVRVVDMAGDPVADADVRTTLDRTGAVVPVTTIIDLAPGAYPILDDSAVPLVTSSAEGFTVTVTRDADSVEARYTFRAPQGCHIEKVSGPDSLVLGSPST